MNVRCTLFVSKAGNVRVNKTGAGVRPNEVAVDVVFTIPDSFFAKPHPTVKIDLPADRSDTQAVVLHVADQVASAMGVNMSRVRDGLLQAMEERAEERER